MLSVSNHISVEAGIVFLRASPVSWTPKRKFLRRFARRGARASSSEASSEERRYSGPKPSRDFVADWVTNNDDLVRSLPIYVGGFSLLAVLFNRAVSGIAPVADASRYGRKFNFSLSLSVFLWNLNVHFDSLLLLKWIMVWLNNGCFFEVALTVFICWHWQWRAFVCALIWVWICVRLKFFVECIISSQSRADLLTLGLAVTNILAGLVWLSIRPKTISVVRLSIISHWLLLNSFRNLFSLFFYHSFGYNKYCFWSRLLLISQVNPQGIECQIINPDLPSRVASELIW